VRNSHESSNLPVEGLLLYLKTSRSGLSSEEAERRLGIYGYNRLAKRKKRAAAVEFILRFRSPLVIILLLAGFISGLLGETVNAAIIFLIVLVSVTLDFYQEYKAERAAEALSQKVRTTATAIRDGVRQEVSLTEIVPGDVVALSAGDIVPADSRVLTAKDLFVDQSALTGESFPVEKVPTAPEPTKNLTERRDGIFMGTSVVSGTGTAVVVWTGNQTEYGKIARALVTRIPETEFERGLRRFGYMIMQVTFLLVIFVFLINALEGEDILQSLLFSVALAVGLTPELLPMILSVNLAKGAISMSKKGVIVKRLASIQNFGSMDVLCTDKTGTLTENRITLVLHVNLEGVEDEKVLLYSFLNSHFETGLKSPLDDAILRHQEIDVRGYEKIDEIPFDFQRKRVSVVVEFHGQRFIVTKGAPEEIVRVCSYCELVNHVFDIEHRTLTRIQRKYNQLSSEGFRVLGVSYKPLEHEKDVYSVSDESDMMFLGFVAFMDPPKESAKESLGLMRRHGIALKILTGDNELVTKKICEELGFESERILLGEEIARAPDETLARIVEDANVFARVTPAQKDRVMNALKKNAHVVGFLGDGINDASSMRIADVGISVDNAVDVAKESADIILLEKDLTVLKDGVLEGRKTFGNTMKYVMMGTSSNFGNMFSVAGASLFLRFLPMLPVQILLNNLLYDLSESTIPTDNVDPEYVDKPRRWDISFVRKFMLSFGPVSSIFDFLTFLILLFVFRAGEALFQTAWFIESLSTQTLVIFVIRTRKTPFFKSRPSTALLLGSIAIVSIALVIPFTPFSIPFSFVAIPFQFYLVLAILVGSYLALVELVKKRFYRRQG
jgi:Mg2+-importing ATPase